MKQPNRKPRNNSEQTHKCKRRTPPLPHLKVGTQQASKKQCRRKKKQSKHINQTANVPKQHKTAQTTSKRRKPQTAMGLGHTNKGLKMQIG